MKRKLTALVVLVALLIPVVFASQNEVVIEWIAGKDYRIKTVSQSAETGIDKHQLANNDGLISLDFIEKNNEYIPFLLTLDGRHVYGGQEFTPYFFPGGAVLVNAKNKAGVMNNAGKLIVPFKYERILYGDEVFLAIDSEKVSYYFDLNGKLIFSTADPVAIPYTEGLAYTSNGVYNKQGQLVFRPAVPLTEGFKYGLAAVSTGQEILLYNTQGTLISRLPYTQVFEWNANYLRVGDNSRQYIVDHSNKVYFQLVYNAELKFDFLDAMGKKLNQAPYDDFRLLEGDKVALLYQLQYYFYEMDGSALNGLPGGSLELFQDGVTLRMQDGRIQIHDTSGRKRASIKGSYLENSLSEETFIASVSQAAERGGRGYYLFDTQGRQLTFRPMTTITKRHLGVNVVYDEEMGIGYIQSLNRFKRVFVMDKFLQTLMYSGPSALLILLLGFLFVRRYKL